MGDVAREVLIRAGVDIVDALRTTIEYGIELFCREAGWIALNTTTANFTSGKVKQLSFHQTGTMPGQIRAKAYQFATDMQTDLYSFGYSATGTTVQQIADIAQDPERTMQELLDAAVAGYVKNV